MKKNNSINKPSLTTLWWLHDPSPFHHNIYVWYLRILKNVGIHIVLRSVNKGVLPGELKIEMKESQTGPCHQNRSSGDFTNRVDVIYQMKMEPAMQPSETETRPQLSFPLRFISAAGPCRKYRHQKEIIQNLKTHWRNEDLRASTDFGVEAPLGRKYGDRTMVQNSSG